MLGSTLRVLLVDDDEEDYMITRDLLDDVEHFSVELYWIDRAEDAIGVIRKQEHDLYLLDYHLGPNNGLEVLREALQLGCRAPFIMLTGQGGRDVDLEAMRMGAYDFLVKGQINAPLLERSMRYALQHARSTEALRSTVKLSSSLLTALNQIEQSVFVIDPQQRHYPIVYANERFLEMMGYAREEVLGQRWTMMAGPGTDEAQMDKIREAMLMGEDFEGTLMHHTSSGEVFEHQLKLCPVASDDGRVVQYVVISQRV